jgi:RimJ/RimL family protein N-acetyltransferase
MSMKPLARLSAVWKRSVAEIVAETERLRLRTWDPDDREEFVRHCNTPAVTRFLGGVQTREEYTAGFERIESSQRDFGHTFWIVERKLDGAMLGFCGLKVAKDLDPLLNGEVEIGWRLREDSWGKGYAREAAEAALGWAWMNLDVSRVISITTAANEPSRRLMERLGMTRRADLDFAHPKFAPGHPLSKHVTYVIGRPRA